MDSMRFAKGIGLGFVVGSAVGMAVGVAQQHSRKTSHCHKGSVIGRALQTVGDIVENIGDSIGL